MPVLPLIINRSCANHLSALFFGFTGLLSQIPVAYSIDFFDNFKDEKVKLPDGSTKPYPNPKVWSYTFTPGIKWPDSYGDGTNYLNGNGECQIYLNPFLDKVDGKFLPVDKRFDPFEVTSDGLRITARPLSTLQRDMYKTNKYRIFGSGMLLTRFSFKYAKIKVVAKLSSAEGSWPAIWMLPTSGEWPPEMDIIEGMPWGKHKGQIHSGYIDKSGGQSASFGEWYKVSKNISEDFHSYELDWNAKDITLRFDDEVVWTKPTPASMHQEMYLIINLAVGGKWPFNELGVQPIDSSDQERLYRGSSGIEQNYPDSFTIKSVRIID